MAKSASKMRQYRLMWKSRNQSAAPPPQPQSAAPQRQVPLSQFTGPVQTATQQQPQPPQPQPQQQANPIQNQVPNNNNTPVSPDPIAKLKGMSDAQLAQLYRNSQTVQMPNHLNDVDDQTQRFVFSIGMNDKPMVLDQAAFNQFMQDNNIPKGNILSRSINAGQLKTTAGNQSNLTPKDIVDMIKYGRLTYIGGKYGGQAYGAGTYLDMNGGANTGYGRGATMTAVLNPATAKIITESRLKSMAQAFDRSHPQFARSTGGYNDNFHNNNMSIYAMILGYNVIKADHGSYHNVIDRKAMVMLQ